MKRKQENHGLNFQILQHFFKVTTKIKVLVLTFSIKFFIGIFYFAKNFKTKYLGRN